MNLRGELRSLGEAVKGRFLEDRDELRRGRFVDPGARPDRLRLVGCIEGGDIISGWRCNGHERIRRGGLSGSRNAAQQREAGRSQEPYIAHR